MQDTLTTLEQCVNMIQQLLPDQLLNSQPKIEKNKAKHTNLLDYDEKSLYLKWLSLNSQKVKL